jgi:hypothetical protein
MPEDVVPTDLLPGALPLSTRQESRRLLNLQEPLAEAVASLRENNGSCYGFPNHPRMPRRLMTCVNKIDGGVLHKLKPA